jgi:NAD(P)-dependent dehydrogenase (short-subunit alcohol dehydrogenase family)
MRAMADSVLITGAGKGLGLSLTRRFLTAGYRVFAGIHQTCSFIKEYQEHYRELLSVIPLNVIDMNSVRAAAEKVSQEVSALEILINNAGVHLENKTVPLPELDLEDKHLQKTMEINAFGPLRVTQRFLPLLEKGHGKIIVNISSEAGSIGDCWRTQEYAYCMSKAALNMQTRILHNYLSSQGFRVKAVHPGWLRTDMGGREATLAPDESAERIFQIIENIRKDSGEESGQRLYVDYQGKELRW